MYSILVPVRLYTLLYLYWKITIYNTCTLMYEYLYCIYQYSTSTQYSVLSTQYSVRRTVRRTVYAPRISFLEIRSKFGSILQNRKIYWSYRYYVLKTKSASKTFHSSITLRFFLSFFTCLQYIITRTPIDFKIDPTLDRVSKKEIRGA